MKKTVERQRTGRRIRLLLAALAASAAAGCASPPAPPPDRMPDPVLVQLTSSAQAAFAVGAYDRAARFYELARARARAMDDGVEVGKQAYNFAACLLLAGRPADARPALAEAAGEFGRWRMDSGPVLLLEARAARMLGLTNEADGAISRIVEMNTPKAVQSQAWLLHGQIACDAGDLKEAGKALSRARHLLDDAPALRAGVAALEGRIALLENRPADAALLFDKEASFMQRAGRYGEMADALGRAGQAYEQAGDPDAAALRYHRSARSLFGRGDNLVALQATERAVAAAAQAGNEALAAEIAALFSEIRASIEVARSAPVRDIE